MVPGETVLHTEGGVLYCVDSDTRTPQAADPQQPTVLRDTRLAQSFGKEDRNTIQDPRRENTKIKVDGDQEGRLNGLGNGSGFCWFYI